MATEKTALVLSLLCTRSIRSLHRYPNPRKGERIPKSYKPRKELLERVASTLQTSESEILQILKGERKRILEKYGLKGIFLDL